MRRFLLPIIVLGVVALVVVGLAQSGGGDSSPTSGATTKTRSLDALRADLAGAPAPFAALYEQAAQILPGGNEAFDARLAQLRGHPVVVNKWASWCTPCRFEFPFFAAEAVARKGEIAFVGLNAADNRADALEFLGEQPIPFPSYEDPDEAIARALKAPANFPITIFYDAQGKRSYIHQGAYRSQADLAEDVERYATG